MTGDSTICWKVRFSNDHIPYLIQKGTIVATIHEAFYKDFEPIPRGVMLKVEDVIFSETGLVVRVIYNHKLYSLSPDILRYVSLV